MEDLLARLNELRIMVEMLRLMVDVSDLFDDLIQPLASATDMGYFMQW